MKTAIIRFLNSALTGWGLCLLSGWTGTVPSLPPIEMVHPEQPIIPGDRENPNERDEPIKPR